MAGTHFKGPLFINGTQITDADGNLIADIQAPAGSIGTAEIANDAITTAKLDPTTIPFIIVAAGQFTTAGGDTAESVTVTGALATDIAIASIEDNGTNNVTLLQTAAATNAVNFTMSANPSTDCIINYFVLRANS